MNKSVSDECWGEWICCKAVANAGVVVVNSKNEVLLLKKENSDGWGVPSGGIDKNEDAKATAPRELFEQASIRLSRENLVELKTFIAKHTNGLQDRTDLVVTYLTYCDAHGDKSEEHVELSWFSLERLVNNPKEITMHQATLKQLKLAWEVVKDDRFPESA
jgi:8-oxo-dGTP pyrophosphatase MutT (NUDIX family)